MNIGRKNGKSGMTLIEILIVIALIGVVVGVLVKSLGGTQDLAKRALAKTFAQSTLKAAALSYKLAYGQWPNSIAQLVGAGLFANEADAANPYGGAYGISIEGDAATGVLRMWTKNSSDVPGDLAGITDANGCAFALTTSGSVREITPAHAD